MELKGDQNTKYIGTLLRFKGIFSIPNQWGKKFCHGTIDCLPKSFILNLEDKCESKITRIDSTFEKLELLYLGMYILDSYSAFNIQNWSANHLHPIQVNKHLWAWLLTHNKDS